MTRVRNLLTELNIGLGIFSPPPVTQPVDANPLERYGSEEFEDYEEYQEIGSVRSGSKGSSSIASSKRSSSQSSSVSFYLVEFSKKYDFSDFLFCS